MTQPNTLHTLPVSTVEPPLSVSRKEDRQDGTMARLLREVKSLRAAIAKLTERIDEMEANQSSREYDEWARQMGDDL